MVLQRGTKGPSSWVRSPETTRDHLDPSETLWRPLEVGGEVWRPPRVYVYPIYYLRPRGRSEPDQKRVLRRGPVHQKRGLERSKIGPKGPL